MNEKNCKLFATPFSAEYWRLSANELKSTRVLVLAALLTALRIAIKSLKIPVGPNLTITFDGKNQPPCGGQHKGNLCCRGSFDTDLISELNQHEGHDQRNR